MMYGQVPAPVQCGSLGADKEGSSVPWAAIVAIALVAGVGYFAMYPPKKKPAFLQTDSGPTPGWYAIYYDAERYIQSSNPYETRAQVERHAMTAAEVEESMQMKDRPFKGRIKRTIEYCKDDPYEQIERGERSYRPNSRRSRRSRT